MLSYEIIYLIYLYIKNLKPRIIFGNKIFYKNVQIHISSKVNILYKLSKVNRTFYLIYKNEINKCKCCNIPIVIHRCYNFNCDNYNKRIM